MPRSAAKLGNGSPVAPGDGAPLRYWSGLPVRMSGLTRWRALTPCIRRMNDIPSRVSLGAWLNRSLKAPQNILELLLLITNAAASGGLGCPSMAAVGHGLHFSRLTLESSILPTANIVGHVRPPWIDATETMSD
jgi:hypothetical protein